nr:PREDICTED: uncharacterized protein LOC109038252 [Bemisia tabaci]
MAGLKVNKGSQTDIPDQMYQLREENENLRKQMENQKFRFGVGHIKSNDNWIKYYTSMHDSKMLDIFLKLFDDVKVNYYYGWTVKVIDRHDQILMTLMKLRLNLGEIDLARQFNVGQSTVSNIVITWIHVFYEVLCEDFMRDIPSMEKIKKCMPSCFRDFPNCRIILDCTEVFIDTPKKLSQQNKT